ncbi:hypothetical protein TELCIR_15082 [Teladorsagia circumcincta]|uniref:Uncharacterized protein n=1 Tax=Teladorsagia circumcincta TaxID=45464 RepID=A0A2G9TZI2_TELCI|nr:hypothetical protein TELCIR_15082 [Teladorsagia circumcincta]
MIHFRILPYPPDVLLNRDVTSEDIKYVREMLDPLQIETEGVTRLRNNWTKKTSRLTAFGAEPLRSGILAGSPRAVMGIRERFIKSAHYFVSMVHSTALESNYSQMSFRKKLENALEKAKEGLPPTIVWQ